MSSRHSSHGSHGGSPQGSHGHSSGSYQHGQQQQQRPHHQQQQQYLSPEDVFRMEREGSYFSSASHSYTPSRHGSSTGSPYFPPEIPPHQRLPSQPISTSTYNSDPYQYAVSDPFLSPVKRDSPPREDRRHGSQTGSRRESPNEDPAERSHSSKSNSPKGKGKAREEDDEGESRRRSSGNDRHAPGGRKKTSGPGNKLVSGVFIRY
jgi:hypothetical protein